MAHRVLAGIKAIGVDEIFWGRGRKSEAFLTVIYQIDGHCRRLLWVGRKRTQSTLRRGLDALGSEVVGGLQYVCSDMWKPYLRVMAQRVGQALHILDRFHITMHLNQAVDQVRRAHEGLILNWFKARGEVCTGATEGLNNKIRVVTRRAYGFRTYKAMEIALYHNLGKLPEPNELTHKFF